MNFEMTSWIFTLCKFRFALVLVLLSFLLPSLRSAHAQEVVIVKVRSYGNGLTEAAAIKDAIVEAVGQVSGERITSRRTAETSSNESSNGTSEFKASFDQKIDSLIRGVVKSSRTLNVSRDPTTNLYKAEVEVGVSTFKQSEQLKRIKLAIVQGSMGLPRGLAADSKSFFQALINGASDKLVTAQKFAILDRQQSDTAQREYSLITTGSTGVENYVRLQSAAVADFLVVIDVSDYVPGKSVLGSDRAKASARAIVYDYTSGQIRQSVNASATRIMRDGSNAALGAQLGAELAERIIENVFPARVIAIEADRPIINAGFGQFDVGDQVQIFRQGKSLKDPYTQESLGVAEIPAAQGVIEMVMPKAAIIKISSGDRLADIKTVSYIVRRSNTPSVPIQGEKSLNTTKKGKQDDDSW
jgi:hypothetical protein